jgi:precorrin-2/cobalt-factor-2 C20-methyltransferase
VSDSIVTAKIGSLFGLGVGPGDPELITVKAYRIIRDTPVIAYPRKRMGDKSYALAIVETFIDTSRKEMVGLTFPMTRDAETLAREWNKTIATVYEYLKSGRDVAFVTEGDPMLYSTFIHMKRLMESLHPEVRVESVPGISSINASASRLGIPLADGDEIVAIVPATDDREQMRKALIEHDAVIFIKVAKVIDLMIDVLFELDLISKAAVVHKVTGQEERIYTDVASLRGSDLGYLTLMVVRK